MKTSVLLRLALLIIFLVIVIWGSVQLRKGGMVGLFASLGADIGNPNYINICPKRIHAVTWPADGKRIDEVKTGQGLDTEWQAHDPSVRPLNYLSLERWLSEHCLTKGESVPASGAVTTTSFTAAVALEYTNGTKKILESAPSDPNTFRWEGRTVRAPLLRHAFDDLRGLAGWPALITSVPALNVDPATSARTSAPLPSGEPHPESTTTPNP